MQDLLNSLLKDDMLDDGYVRIRPDMTCFILF